MKTKKQIKHQRFYHDHFDSLGYRVGFFILLLLNHSGEVAQLPDRMAFLTFTGQLQEQINTVCVGGVRLGVKLWFVFIVVHTFYFVFGIIL